MSGFMQEVMLVESTDNPKLESCIEKFSKAMVGEYIVLASMLNLSKLLKVLPMVPPNSFAIFFLYFPKLKLLHKPVGKYYYLH